MSFQTGLSGLSAASQSLDVIGNNIANANTVGMKASTAEFANIVASAIGAGGASNSAGIGTSVTTISENFSQGNINITGNSLDVAINGNGFFPVTRSDGTTAYTRDGEFKLDKNGNIMTNQGSYLMGYPTDNTGAQVSSTLQKMQLPTTAPIDAKQTSTIAAEFNLNASAAATTTTTSATQFGTSLTAYDPQGVAIPVSLYFVKNATPNTWDVYTDATAAQTAVTTNTPAGDFQMTFNPDGSLNTTTPTSPSVTLQAFSQTGGTDGQGHFSVAIDVSKATQFGVPFAVSNLTQDGYTSGQYTGLSIDNKGVITTTYSNGQTMKNGGMIALSNFRNVQGLAQIGGGEYLETDKSGAALNGQPTVGNFGELRSGAVEESNVDLTSELVNMMTAQRNYQANAQTIKTQDQIMSTLVNLR